MNSHSYLQTGKKLRLPQLRSLFAVFMMLFISSAAYCQQQTDQDIVIQKCIDMNEIQAFFPKKPDNTYKHVYVLQFPVFFEGNPTLTKFGKPVSFLQRPELNGEHPDAYISFQKFNITGNTAEAVFTFSYDRFAAEPHLETLNVNLEKTAGVWTIINTTTNKL